MKSTGAANGSTGGTLFSVAAAEDVDAGVRTASGAVASSERRRGRRGGRLRESGGGGVLAGWRGTMAANFTRITQCDHRRAPGRCTCSFYVSAYQQQRRRNVCSADGVINAFLQDAHARNITSRARCPESVGQLVATTEPTRPKSRHRTRQLVVLCGFCRIDRRRGLLDVWGDWVPTGRRRIAGERRASRLASGQPNAAARMRRCCAVRCCGYEPCIQQQQQQTPVANSTSATLSCIFRARRRQLVRHRTALSIIYFSVNPLKRQWHLHLPHFAMNAFISHRSSKIPHVVNNNIIWENLTEYNASWSTVTLSCTL